MNLYSVRQESTRRQIWLFALSEHDVFLQLQDMAVKNKYGSYGQNGNAYFFKSEREDEYILITLIKQERGILLNEVF